VLLGPGENAGVVDVGRGRAIAFKVESHNHPSAVEPFQGAATGVGGILRDVFAVGARPIAVLDSLRFGEPTSERSRYLLERAVAGIGHYGNSIGVPTVGGEIYFEEPYEQNCLVNAMCVGLTTHERVTRSAAAGPGNRLVLIGALTGRDGIGGASVLASAELDEADESKRPSVQIGDPFAEKKLLECCLELLDRELLVSLQDLGAAGLTSSSSEMASKGAVGLEIDVAAVPLREPDMEPFEIMVSESQERMLCVVEPGRVADVLELCEKWETNAAVIGQVVEGERLVVKRGDEVVGDMPVTALVDECPLYDLAPVPPSAQIYGATGGVHGSATLGGAPTGAGQDLAKGAGSAAAVGAAHTTADTLKALLCSPNICSRRGVFEQYDCLVQSRTVRRPDAADAAVLRLEDGGAIAVSIDCNGRRVACEPRTGAAEAVYECAANLACVGAEPLGLTNCLNFGNPEKPHVAWQLVEAVEGLAQACESLDVPVVGGNVSLYNESPSGPIYPTPVVGMVGYLPDPSRSAGIAFLNEGDVIALIGDFNPEVSGSELAKLRGQPLAGPLPIIDTQAVRDAQDRVRAWVRDEALHSAHDIAEGGLAVALAECAIAGGIGAALDLDPEDERWLFGEAPGRAFVVSGPASVLGGQRIIGRVGGTTLFGVPVQELAKARVNPLVR
jgi:phosphoribosylformylglycinamidine synthase